MHDCGELAAPESGLVAFAFPAGHENPQPPRRVSNHPHKGHIRCESGDPDAEGGQAIPIKRPLARPEGDDEAADQTDDYRPLEQAVRRLLQSGIFFPNNPRINVPHVARSHACENSTEHQGEVLFGLMPRRCSSNHCAHKSRSAGQSFQPWPPPFFTTNFAVAPSCFAASTKLSAC